MIFTKWMMFNEVPKHPRLCILDKIRLNSNKGESTLLLSYKFSPPFEFPRNIYEENLHKGKPQKYLFMKYLL
jgi:hypothetical protein